MCTVCGSDLHTFAGRRPGPVPGALGHEIIGTIEAFGPGKNLKDLSGKALKPGDRITWLMYAFDPEDPVAQKGFPQKSRFLFKYGHEAITDDDALHSGFAEYLIIRKGTAVCKIPDVIPDPVATPINCALATSMAAIRLSNPEPDDQIAVFGCGLLGLYIISFLKSAGFESIYAIDLKNERLEVARKMGASGTLIFPCQPPHKFHIIYEMSGTTEAMELAANFLHIGGTAIYAGATFPQPEIRLSGEIIVRNILTIKGIHNYQPDDLRNAVEFISKYHTFFPFSNLVERIYPLHEINQAFKFALEKQPVRIAIVPHAEI
jgi:alcohol dehydrogenase